MGFVEELGEIALVSRMRRLAERMHQDNAVIFREQQLPFESRWFLLLHLLHKKYPLSIMEIAKDLGLSHPSVNQLAEEIQRHGFISSVTDPQDKRRRLLALTDTGQQLVQSLMPVLQDMKSAAHELITASGYDVLDVLSRIESLLEQEGYTERVRRHMQQRVSNQPILTVSSIT